MTNTAEHLKVIEGSGQDGLVGRTIDGRYQVERVLGEGGMGLVYRAKHTVLGKPLAVKVLRPDVSRDDEIITRFRQEAQSASAIGNQHIIDISDFGTLPDGSTYFVMEYLDGTDLTKVIEQQSPIPPHRIVHIAKQLCDALGSAHDIGIVHRDLKPDNIYLIRRGKDQDFVKVLDFGIAKVGGSSSKLTRAGQVFGTPHYMSPEQCAGSGVDHRTDIYAIGTILYEMVTGRTPFDADNPMGILTKHLYEEPVPPTQIRPDCPRDLESIILRCITKKAENRYQTCRELFEDLQRVEAGITPVAVTTMARLSATSAVPSGAVPLDAAGGKSSSKGFIIAGVVLALLGAAGTAAVVLRPTPAPPQTARPPAIVTPPATPQTPQTPPAQNNQQGTQAGTQPAAPAEQPKVRVVTEPAGAEVWASDSFIGPTPIDIPRPQGDARLQIQIRAHGYESREVTLSSLTLAPELHFRLEPQRPGGRPQVGHPPGTATPMAEPTQMTETTMHRPQSEVLDPWAN